MDALAPGPDLRVLDVGFSESEGWETDNYIERHYPYPQSLTALGIDEPREFLTRYPAVKAVTYDGGTFPFADKTFDVCWSNAVLEHVGDAGAQVAFLREIRRVSHRAFITTPNRHFPVEVHTSTPLLHFLPKRWFDYYLIKTGRSKAAGDFMYLLSERDLRTRLATAGFERYRLVKNRVGGFTMDFAVLAICD